MDEADLAQQNQEHFQRLALKHHRENQLTGESASECEDCGEPIPEARRLAAPGCRRCLSCQNQYERRPH